MRRFPHLAHYMAQNDFVLETDDDTLQIGVRGALRFCRRDPHRYQGKDDVGARAGSAERICAQVWDGAPAPGPRGGKAGARSLMMKPTFVFATGLIAAMLVPGGPAAAAPTKAELGAMLKKCSDEADAKGLTVQKGKGTERTVYRRQCMQKNGVAPRKP